jgi:hypothetical protein
VNGEWYKINNKKYKRWSLLRTINPLGLGTTVALSHCGFPLYPLAKLKANEFKSEIKNPGINHDFFTS